MHRYHSHKHIPDAIHFPTRNRITSLHVYQRCNYVLDQIHFLSNPMRVMSGHENESPILTSSPNSMMDTFRFLLCNRTNHHSDRHKNIWTQPASPQPKCFSSCTRT